MWKNESEIRMENTQKEKIIVKDPEKRYEHAENG